jgi:hypothetical protein
VLATQVVEQSVAIRMGAIFFSLPKVLPSINRSLTSGMPAAVRGVTIQSSCPTKQLRVVPAEKGPGWHTKAGRR